MAENVATDGESLDPAVVALAEKVLARVRAAIPPKMRSVIGGSDIVQSALREYSEIKSAGIPVGNDLGLLVHLIALKFKEKCRFLSQARRNVFRNIQSSELPAGYVVPEAASPEVGEDLSEELHRLIENALSDLDETSILAWRLRVVEGKQIKDVIEILRADGRAISPYRLRQVVEIVGARIKRALEQDTAD